MNSLNKSVWVCDIYDEEKKCTERKLVKDSILLDKLEEIWRRCNAGTIMIDDIVYRRAQ